MALTKVEQDICQFVVHGLLEQGDVTRKQALLKKFKGFLSDALRKLVDRAVLRAVEQVYNQETYLPRAIAFHYCGDSEALAFAKKSTKVVLPVLLNLYEQEFDERKQFKPSDVENEARNLKLAADQMTVRTGLYFAEEVVLCSVSATIRSVYLVIHFNPKADVLLIRRLPNSCKTLDLHHVTVLSFESKGSITAILGQFSKMQSKRSRKFIVHEIKSSLRDGDDRRASGSTGNRRRQSGADANCLNNRCTLN